MRLLQMFIVIVVLLGIFFFLKSFGKQNSKGPRRFKGAKFSSVRREINKGELKQDPISGTYLTEEDAIKKRIDGKDYYFATEDNYNEFMKKRKEDDS